MSGDVKVGVEKEMTEKVMYVEFMTKATVMEGKYTLMQSVILKGNCGNKERLLEDAKAVDDVVKSMTDNVEKVTTGKEVKLGKEKSFKMGLQTDNQPKSKSKLEAGGILVGECHMGDVTRETDQLVLLPRCPER